MFGPRRFRSSSPSSEVQYSSDSMAEYKPQQLDKKWQQSWAASKAFEVEIDPSRPKYYALDMFAYPPGTRTWGTCATTRSATS